MFTTDILDTDKFWNDEILRVNDEFLFGCATGCFDNWKDGGKYTNRKGIVPMHAYSIMDAREIDGQRLLRLRCADSTQPMTQMVILQMQESMGQD